MLNKNPEQILDNDLTCIQNEFVENIPNIILSFESFDKVEFLDRLINLTRDPIVFVDVDLLYTGYIESGMIHKNTNITIIQPNKANWKKEFAKITNIASNKRHLIIIDSFNGIYNLFDDFESARIVNSCIMLLASIGHKTGSSVIVTALVRQGKYGNDWVVSPGGKRIIKSEKTGIFFLKKINGNLVLAVQRDDVTDLKIFTIEKQKHVLKDQI